MGSSRGATGGLVPSLGADERDEADRTQIVHDGLSGDTSYPGEFLGPRLRPDRDHEAAAKCFNTCRAKGLQGSNTDFFLCAVSVGHQLPILTTDRDFDRYARLLPIVLHPIP